MPILYKFLLLVINAGIVVFFAFTQSYSLALFFSMLLLYQIGMYISFKEIKKVKRFNQRLKIATSIFIFVVIAIIARAVNIQIIENKNHSERASEQSSSEETKAGKRGVVYDATGKKLAYNTYVYNVAIDPTKVADNEKALDALRELYKRKVINVSIDPMLEDFKKLSSEKKRFKIIDKKIEESKKEAIELYLKEKGLKNDEIFFEKILERKYYKSDIYQNLVGNIGYPPDQKGRQKIGVFGLEKMYESYLKESIIVIKDFFTKRRDIKLPTSQARLESSLNGKNLVLTIDEEINYILNDEMEKQFKNTKSEEAYAVIMNPNNGKIIATSYFSSLDRELRNPIFQDQFEPGSTLKPLIVAAAMEEKLIGPSTMFHTGNGSIQKSGHTIRESTKRSYGSITTEEILKKSSNVGMVMIAEQFSNKHFEEWLRKFGFYEKTGVDFPNELKPYTTVSEKWDALKKYTMSFGQGIAMTPIQLITAFSAIINGGTMYKPYLVDRIEDDNGIVIRRNLPVAKGRIISESVSDEVKKMMENTVTDGTGKNAIVNGYRIGGKTGTAQVAKSNGGYFSNEYLASFIGFLPVDKPEYAILIMFMKPQGETTNQRYGGSVGAPVFGEVVSRITKSKNMISKDVKELDKIIEPTVTEEKNSADYFKKLVEDKPKNENLYSKLSDSKLTDEEVDPNAQFMPDLEGFTSKEVLNIFKDKDFKLVISGKGNVKRQIPEKGANLDSIYEIKIELEEGWVKVEKKNSGAK